MSLSTVLLVLHACAGTLTLGAMLVAVLSPKGGRVHRRGGLVFVGSMLMVSLSAWALAALRISQGDDAARALFLAFVASLAFVATLDGQRSVRRAAARQAKPMPVDVALSATLGALALGLLVFAGLINSVLAALFAAFGLFYVQRRVRYLRALPNTHAVRVAEHLTAMGTAAIASVTAFVLVVGSAQGLGGIALWVTPGVIGGALIVWQRRVVLGTSADGLRK